MLKGMTVKAFSGQIALRELPAGSLFPKISPACPPGKPDTYASLHSPAAGVLPGRPAI